MENFIGEVLKQGFLGVFLAIALWVIRHLYMQKNTLEEEFRKTAISWAEKNISVNENTNATLKMLADKIDEGRKH